MRKSEPAGNFSCGWSVFVRERGWYEGLFHKPADEDLADARSACGAAGLSADVRRGSGRGARHGAGSGALGAERNLVPCRKPLA